MLSWLAAALAFLIGFVAMRAWWIERKKRLVAEHRVVERPNSFYASKAVHNQEDEEWWRRIELEPVARAPEPDLVGRVVLISRA